MFDYSYFETLSEGDEKLRYLKKCIVTADHEKNISEALELRYRYIEESIFNGDCFNALIMFPEYMTLFENNTDKHSYLSFMKAFKWFIEEIPGFYQITAGKADEYFEKYREYLNVFGYSMRTYHMLKVKYCMVHDQKNIKNHLELYRKCEKDDLSDCQACETDMEIQAELIIGSEEKAVKKFLSMIQRNISCCETPQKTYGKFTEHFTRTGNLDEADYYAEMLIPFLHVNMKFLSETGYILLLKSFTSPNQAYSIFCKYLEIFIRCRNPKMKFYFAMGAAAFFEKINRDENEQITMKLPRTFELFNEDNLYDPDIMFDYFHEIASEIAKKFDRSYGNTYYSDILNFEYPSEPVRELSLPEHGTIERSPFSVAVPFTNEELIPSPEKISELLRTIPDIEYRDISVDDQNSMTIYGYNSYIETEFLCRIAITEPDYPEEYFPVHNIPAETVENFVNTCKTFLVISTLFHKGTENAETTALLQFANALNTENSPVILCVTNGTIFSSEWVKFHTEGRLPLFDKYMYGIHAMPSHSDENKYDMVTSGLVQQGSRDLAICEVDEEDLEFVNCVFSQISDLICGFTELRDEGCVTGFGVVYNEESEVQFSWMPVHKAYPDYFSDEENELAVPVLYLSADDVDRGKYYFINEIPADVRHKIDFRSSLKSIRIESVLSRRNLPFAFDALERVDNSELIICLTVYPTDEDAEEDDILSDEICIKAVCIDTDENTVTGQVVVDSPISPEYELDNLITLSIDDILFWRFESDGRYYSSDDTYLFENLK